MSRAYLNATSLPTNRSTPHESGCRRIPRAPRVVMLGTAAASEWVDTLDLWGFHPAVSGSVEDTLRWLAEGECLALVVDLELPGVDVLGLLSVIRRHEPTRGLPVVATARASDAALLELARERGCDVVLTGAPDPDRLAMEVEAALAHPGRACASA